MKPNLSYLYLFLITITVFNCSPEESTNVPTEDNNVFTFNGETYNLVSAIITDENTANNDSSEIGISLFNKTSSEITSNADLSDITFVYLEVDDVTIQNTTYNQIEDYDISVGGAIIESEFNAGTILLSDNDPDADVYAQSGVVTVTNFTAFNITFTFSFTRNDGEVISGSYNGNFLAPNGID